MALVSHLGNNLIFFGSFHHQLNLIKGSCHWFFHKYMFPHCHGHHADWKMRMIRHTNYHSVNLIVHFLKHYPEVLKSWNIRKSFESSGCMGSAHISVAKGNNIGKAGTVESPDNASTLVADATTCDVDPVAGF